MKIVIIEDDERIIEYVKLTFQLGWPEVELISTEFGEKGAELVEAESPKLVILDLVLPDISGFEVLKQIRLFSAVPILVLTVSEEEFDIVKALAWGADEYIIKPFRQMEFIARIKALIRRQVSAVDANETEEYNLLSWRFNPYKHLLKKAGKSIFLTRTESTILLHLIRNKGSIIRIQGLVKVLYEEDYPGATDAVRVYIRRLRQKIETESKSPQIILTKIGLGYYIEADKVSKQINLPR